MEEKRKGISEDWLALWLGLGIFILSLGVFAGVDILGWAVKTSTWTNLSEAFSPVSKHFKEKISGIASLIFTYLFMLVVMGVGALALRINLKKFIIGFTIVFWVAYACWTVGHYAYIAATDPEKAGVPWSLRLTGEAGYILALVVGLLVGNFMPWLSNILKDAIRPELYVKTAIVIMGAALGIKAAEAFGLATAVMFRGLCAIVEAYLIYWALVYFIARKYFKFSREWAAPLASGISICGISAAIATGAAIRARPVVPIMVSSLVVVFSVVELMILPFLAQLFLWKEPLVAGAWMGLAIKTDGAAIASGAITDSLIRAKVLVKENINYAEGWILMTTTTTKIFIDIFIGIWAFLLAYIWCAKIERKPEERIGAREIWNRFPKFVLGYAATFIILVLICLPASRAIGPVKEKIDLLKQEVSIAEKKLLTADPATQADLNEKIKFTKDKIKGLEAQIKEPKKTISDAKAATRESTVFRKLFFLITFFSIGVVSNFRKLWEEGIGKLAAVYLICLFGFIIWIGLLISWIFFHGVKPPIVIG